MLEISAEELAKSRTWITDFIFDKTKNEKTFGELEIIFESCLDRLTPELDGTNNDLRILQLQEKIGSGKWVGWIELERNRLTGNIEEGIHRGIAYLRCIKSGIEASSLPKFE